MRKSLLFAALLTALTATAQYAPTAGNLQARADFSAMRFGIFLHWGIYSQYAQGEWYLENGRLSEHEYAKAASGFYPAQFDATAWVRAIKASGARYITFTSRHHDGFSMWNTAESNYNIVSATHFHRDVLGELAAACRAEGIRLHLYYSLLDWRRTDYPIGRTGHHTGRTVQPDYDAYFGFMKRQVNELLTGYDGVEGIWLDGYWDHSRDSVPFDWRMPEFYDYIHSLNPSCLIGNNHHENIIEGEDFQMFERDLPGQNRWGYDHTDVSALPLEMCETMNGMWGYQVSDTNYKSSRELITLIERAAAKGSNLLLNIGPQADGNLPEVALQRLSDIGRWMAAHGESIYGTTAGEDYDWGVTTHTADRIYLHVLADTTTISMPLPRKPQQVSAPYRYDRRSRTLSISPVAQYDVITVTL